MTRRPAGFDIFLPESPTGCSRRKILSAFLLRAFALLLSGSFLIEAAVDVAAVAAVVIAEALTVMPGRSVNKKRSYSPRHRDLKTCQWVPTTTVGGWDPIVLNPELAVFSTNLAHPHPMFMGLRLLSCWAIFPPRTLRALTRRRSRREETLSSSKGRCVRPGLRPRRDLVPPWARRAAECFCDIVLPDDPPGPTASQRRSSSDCVAGRTR
jgi:hypothetical protein